MVDISSMNQCLFFTNHLDTNEIQDIIIDMSKRKKKTKKSNLGFPFWLCKKDVSYSGAM